MFNHLQKYIGYMVLQVIVLQSFTGIQPWPHDYHYKVEIPAELKHMLSHGNITTKHGRLGASPNGNNWRVAGCSSISLSYVESRMHNRLSHERYIVVDVFYIHDHVMHQRGTWHKNRPSTV